MTGRSDSREVPLDDRDWWSSPDEGYWQALVEQGEFAPELFPAADPLEAFQTLGMEPETAPDDTNGPDAEDGWQRAQRAYEKGELFCLPVSGANRGGLLVDWNGLQGFVPASHLNEMPLAQTPDERAAELATRIGDALTVRLIEVDARQNRLVLSERAAAADHRPPEAILDSLHPGDVCQGSVTNLTNFGAFVDLGGVEGLIHISELSWDRVPHPSDVLEPGQDVQVYVIGVNAREGRIALSLKRLRPDPWEKVTSRYRVGDIIEGTVTNVVSFGAFVRVEEGLEGLVHTTELAEGSFMHPRSVVREGERVHVRVLKIDAAHHRLGLSLRQAHRAGQSG